MSITQSVRTYLRSHPGHSAQFNSIAQYNAPAANCYRQLVSSKEYIERQDVESKPTFQRLTEQQKQRISHRLLHPDLIQGHCLVCLDYSGDEMYCSTRCMVVARTIRKSIKKLHGGAIFSQSD